MSEKPPAYAPCEITMAFGDADHLFRLPLAQLAEYQEKCRAGIGEIYRRMMTGNYWIEDVHEAVRLGLIGGGMEPTQARVLMERYLDPMPVESRWNLALAIVSACVVGYEPPGKQSGKAQAAMMQEDGSTSPPQSETEPSQGTPSAT